MAKHPCKWLSDDDQEICTNADCPCVADFCPCVHYPEICEYREEANDGD